VFDGCDLGAEAGGGVVDSVAFGGLGTGAGFVDCFEGGCEAALGAGFLAIGATWA